jgi:hypothetical protein
MPRLSKTSTMKRFNTKKDLLRYLGKNEDDRKLVTRMVERGEVRLEWRVYIIDEEEVSEIPSSSSDLEYLNKEYEKLEGLLDYSLRKCYDIMKKKGLVGSEDTYDDFYNKITEWYQGKLEVKTDKEVERGNGWEKDLGSIVKTFGIMKASDLI